MESNMIGITIYIFKEPNRICIIVRKNFILTYMCRSLCDYLKIFVIFLLLKKLNTGFSLTDFDVFFQIQSSEFAKSLNIGNNSIKHARKPNCF